MKTAEIKVNGGGIPQIFYGAVEKNLAKVFGGALTAILATSVIGFWTGYGDRRELKAKVTALEQGMTLIQAQNSDQMKMIVDFGRSSAASAEIVSGDLKDHIAWSLQERPKLVTKDELQDILRALDLERRR